ncbi:hypothetical protein Tco_0120059, partial [Tanacetum coccineum]
MQSKQVQIQTDAGSDRCIAQNYINTEMNERQTGRQADKQRIQSADSDRQTANSVSRFKQQQIQTADSDRQQQFHSRQQMQVQHIQTADGHIQADSRRMQAYGTNLTIS